MPLKSKAQQRLAYASAAGMAKDGMPVKVAKRFIEETPKKAYAKMPEQVKRNGTTGPVAPSRKVAAKRK